MVLDIVARLSSRVFLGPDICRNEEWLDITKNYALVAIKSVKVLQGYPNVLKPLVYFTHPFCRTAQQQYKRASKIITPVVKQRSKERQEFIAKGLAPPIYNDAIAWAEAELAGDPFTPADVQLFFSGAAIHTTSDLLTQTLLQLSANPAYIPPLREEIVQVLGAAGWKKTALTNLKLLDSAIKEAQRVKPLHMSRSLGSLV